MRLSEKIVTKSAHFLKNYFLTIFFQMSCVVPGCSTGYGSSKVPEGVTQHQIPKDPLRRLAWQKAIPREDWVPSDRSLVCSLHFTPSDYEETSTDTNKYRKTNLKLRRLKKSAIPTQFPGLPSYLSKSKKIERSGQATSSQRWAALQDRRDTEVDAFFESDLISGFDALKSHNFPNFPKSWSITVLKKVVMNTIFINRST